MVRLGRRAVLLALLVVAAQAPLASAKLVISQIYGDGGNSSTSAWDKDYIVLFNAGTTAVNVNNWAVWFEGPTDVNLWLETSLSNNTLAPGDSYLVAFKPHTSLQPILQPFDLFGGALDILMRSGKVALTSTTTAPTASNTSGSNIVDFVGYGPDADTFKVAPAPSPGTGAILRVDGGCQDTGDNETDFSTGAAVPRSLASPAAPCIKLTAPSSPQSVAEGHQLSFSLTATAGSTVTATGIASDPRDLAAPSLTHAGASWTFTWTPGFDRAAASPYTVRLNASSGAASTTATVRINVANTDRAPVLDAGGGRTVTVGHALHVRVSATDPDGDTIRSRGVLNPPPGSKFNAATGAFDWTPSTSEVGTRAITFTASDGLLSGRRTIRVTVKRASISAFSLADRQVSSSGVKLMATLTGPGTIVVTFARCARGKCSPLKGAITFRGKTGLNHFRLVPRLRGHRLKRGRYLLRVGIQGAKATRTLIITVT